jgi:hypothetical protein
MPGMSVERDRFAEMSGKVAAAWVDLLRVTNEPWYRQLFRRSAGDDVKNRTDHTIPFEIDPRRLWGGDYSGLDGLGETYQW